MRGFFSLLLLFPLMACPTPGDDSQAPCVPPYAVFTDIDETLTTTDEEWLAQLGDPAHDPAMRPGADALMQGYAERGYAVFYVTARGEELELSDGRSARQASEDWLVAHGFPYAEGQLYLAEGLGALGDSAVEYKSEVIMDLEAEGWQADWAYGNADTDILAFQAAGIPDDHIFLVGELAGSMGVQPIVDEDAYEAHITEQLPEVGEVACP
jgi:phosphatidate phosphatase PAH1